MLPWDQTGKIGPKKPLPDHVTIVEPKEGGAAEGALLGDQGEAGGAGAGAAAAGLARYYKYTTDAAVSLRRLLVWDAERAGDTESAGGSLEWSGTQRERDGVWNRERAGGRGGRENERPRDLSEVQSPPSGVVQVNVTRVAGRWPGAGFS